MTKRRARWPVGARRLSIAGPEPRVIPCRDLRRTASLRQIRFMNTMVAIHESHASARCDVRDRSVHWMAPGYHSSSHTAGNRSPCAALLYPPPRAIHHTPFGAQPIAATPKYELVDPVGHRRKRGSSRRAGQSFSGRGPKVQPWICPRKYATFISVRRLAPRPRRRHTPHTAFTARRSWPNR